jgi:hypothetical protein
MDSKTLMVGKVLRAAVVIEGVIGSKKMALTMALVPLFGVTSI